MKIDLEGGKLRLYGGPRDVGLVRLIGGWHAARLQPGVWEAEPGWGVLLATSGVFGAELAPTPAVNAWADQQIAREEYAVTVKAGGWAPRDPAAWDGGFGYQVLGGTFAADMERVLIGDDMGTGKTVQAALALRYLDRMPLRPSPWPVLVVSPNTMLYTWAEELEKWAPVEQVVVLPKGKQRRIRALEQVADRVGMERVAVVTNWESLRTLGRLAPYGSIALKGTEAEDGPMNSVPWATVILDEAHRLADPASKQTRAAWYLAHHATYRWAMTGTPVRNDPGDLWGVMHALAPEDFPVRSTYITRYTFTGLNEWGTQTSYAFNPATKPELDRFFEPRFIRRTLAETRPDVPRPLPPQVRWVDMGQKQERAYEQMRKHMLAEVDGGIVTAANALTKLTRLLQFAAATPVIGPEGEVEALAEPSCKVDALLEMLADEYAGEQVVVFASSRKLIELVDAVLAHRKYEAVTIHGGVSPEGRKLAVDTFQHGDTQLALVTLGAGSEGITLTAARHGLFLQRDHSMVKNVQAEGRLVRHGQLHPVQYVDVVTRNSAEDGVHDALARKEATLQELVRDTDFVRRVLVRG